MQSINFKSLTLKYSDFDIEAGIDEAGRGCLAGPVFAAAVILPANYSNSILQDSKQLSLVQRQKAREIILNDALAFSVAKASVEEVDKLNILQASFLAMHRAIDQLKIQPQFLLIDGNRFLKYKNLPHQCVIKGDSRFQNIAAASILAKTFRDDLMINLSNEFPEYAWESNKGYGSLQHRIAIAKYGLSSYHRKTFHLKNQLIIDFDSVK